MEVKQDKIKQDKCIENQIEKYRDGKELTVEYTVKGIGTVKVYGSLDFEELIKRLMQTKYINS